MKRIAVIVAALVLAAGILIAVVVTTGSDPGASRAEAIPEEDFIPSEELPAGSAISFPVDI